MDGKRHRCYFYYCELNPNAGLLQEERRSGEYGAPILIEDVQAELCTTEMRKPSGYAATKATEC